ncbi:hypothetical protein F3Y22_tig00116995pilonHSYRG00008 [Hibiscus syriacus]|uniref:Uncharacterized protein n=1 Tax=Hibiscus syriacus TaxID=106335 RepID=A0A6A2XG00_HIBSY|nr:hypothetical protein F3Y22_tig00116995pilonHSYRG00008 [Hibiscus syriacus]
MVVDSFSQAPIVGVVDEDKLVTLRDSLVGWCKKFMKMKDMVAIMHKEGILGPKIMRLSGLTILIIFEDEESRDHTLLNQSEALKNCFDKVEVWSENFQCCSLRAWLSCRGIPPFVWSHSTFRNIAKKWGELIFIEEGTLNPGSFDRALFHIIIKCKARVEESIDLVVGERIVSVFVSEFEPCFGPDSVWEYSSLMAWDIASPASIVEEIVEVSSEKSPKLEVGVVCSGLMGAEVELSTAIEDNAAHFSLCQWRGYQNALINYNIMRVKGKDLGVSLGGKAVVFPSDSFDGLASRALANIFGCSVPSSEAYPWQPKSNSDNLRLLESLSFEQVLTNRLIRKQKKFGSLLDIQDKFLSKAEKNKRDRALKRLKLLKSDLNSSELSGSSLYDSDLKKRWDVLVGNE